MRYLVWLDKVLSLKVRKTKLWYLKNVYNEIMERKNLDNIKSYMQVMYKNLINI